MERIRKPFRGVTNIVRFNWHFYVLSLAAVLSLLLCNSFLQNNFHFYINALCVLIVAGTLVSLLVSFYVYDLSRLYSLGWLNKLPVAPTNKLININAGFDETSILLNAKYPNAQLKVFDFYNPEMHTEISIKRARKAYPPYEKTVSINTYHIPLPNLSADTVFIIFAAHEIRNDAERILFFKELNRVLNQSGKIVVTEHVRDVFNFLAYNVGFFHFLPKAVWLNTFTRAGFRVCGQIKITPFVTTFIIEKNGASS